MPTSSSGGQGLPSGRDRVSLPERFEVYVDDEGVLRADPPSSLPAMAGSSDALQDRTNTKRIRNRNARIGAVMCGGCHPIRSFVRLLS